MNNKIRTHNIQDRIESVNRQLSAYIPMPDGIKIAAEIWLPDNFKLDTRVPVAVSLTRYWRVAEGHIPDSRIMPLAKCGIAVAIVDCRGTGASFGSREIESSGREVADFSPIIKWLARQSWSNGSVVSIGVSYCANTAELAMVDAPSALKAAIPLFSDYDVYAHNGFPGGLLNSRLLKPWGEGVRAMDLNETEDIHPLWEEYRGKTIKAVTGDVDKRQLAQAIQEHRSNVPLSDSLAVVEFRCDFNFAESLDDSARFVSPHMMQKNRRLCEVPSYHWASFTDAGTAAGAIARFLNSSAPMRVVIGYWSHGAEFGTDPFDAIGLEPSPNVDNQWQHLAEYIHALCDDKQSTTGSGSSNNLTLKTERTIYYYTAGAKCWRKTQVWPPAGISMQRWFLNDQNILSIKEPSEKNASDEYAVDFDAGTGTYPRWDQIVKEVHYGDRSEPDKKLLTYTSAPLDQAIEITGHPVVCLQMSSTQTDGAIIVYLETVAPDGTVTMLTEGGLRLIHRKVSDSTPPYPQFGPYHSYEKKEALPMPVGQVVKVSFECLPLSVQVLQGHALRVAIAGHDKNCFDRMPQEGEVSINIFRQSSALSFIELPIRYLGSQTLREKDVATDPFSI